MNAIALMGSLGSWETLWAQGLPIRVKIVDLRLAFGRFYLRVERGDIRRWVGAHRVQPDPDIEQIVAETLGL